MAAPTLAADLEMEQELGLIVSGKVDSWAGAQFLDRGPFSDKTVFALGGEGLLSLPLGENLSLQSDFKYEYNDQSNDFIFSSAGPRYSYQFAGHLSWRDPSTGLFGIFGGAGTTNTGIIGDTDIAFIGGEFQFYTDNITWYGQGGYLSYRDDNLIAANFGLDDGYFVRGVMRWFVTDDSRFQVEGSYFNSDFELSGNTDAFSFGARYDFSLGLPVIGDTALYIAWRGQWRSSCLRSLNDDNYGLSDQTIMVGSSYSFSGDLMTVDRQGATLDTPHFTHGCGRYDIGTSG